jgi:ketol-acid reductoisomerase
MVAEGIDASYASKLIQYGWETITEIKIRRNYQYDGSFNPAKIATNELKDIMRPCFKNIWMISFQVISLKQ